MAKYLKIAGTLLLIFVVSYLGAHYWIRWKNTVHDDVTKITKLVDCEPNDVRYISILQDVEGKGEELEFTRVDNAAPGVPPVVAFAEAEWKFLKPLTGEADATLLRRIASTLCELYDPTLLRAEDMVLSPPGKRSARKLRGGMKGKGDAETLAIEFGAVGPDRMSFISLSKERKQRFAKIPERFQQIASLPPAEYRSLQVMRMAGDNLQVATLKFNGKERFTLERSGAGWRVLVNGKETGAASEEANRFVNRLATLKGMEVLEPEYSPERCRQETARAELLVRGVAGREESLRFDYGRGGDISACSTGRSMKFRVHRDLLKYIDVQPRALIAK